MNINAYLSNTKILDDTKASGVANDNSGAVTDNTSINFLDTLKGKLNEVNDKQIEADTTTQKFVSGEEDDISKVMLSTEEAKLSLEMAVQIRNKIVEAYDVFNRMQI